MANGALSADGKRMAQIAASRGIVVSALAGNTVAIIPRAAIGCGQADIEMPAWSPDGMQLAVACGNRIVVLDALTGEQKGVMTAPIEEAGVWSLTWSPNGEWLAYYLDTAQAPEPALWGYL